MAVLGSGIRVGSPKFRVGNGRMAAGKWTVNNLTNSLICSKKFTLGRQHISLGRQLPTLPNS